MSTQVKGVIARSVKAPVEVVTVNVPDPGPGEALVQVQACGVCHTDLHYREGGITDDFPFLLGHEAAGIVETVGSGVVQAQGHRPRLPVARCSPRRRQTPAVDSLPCHRP